MKRRKDPDAVVLGRMGGSAKRRRTGKKPGTRKKRASKWKYVAATELGRKGGLARARKLTAQELHDIAMKGVEARNPEERSENARKAAKARWQKARQKRRK